jgi:hypothetical protein
VAAACDVDDKDRVLRFIKPSIINGSQTQGVLNDYFEKYDEESRFLNGEPHIKFEVIVTDDEDLVANISIARNFQNDVMALSIVGRRKQLDELEERFQKVYPDLRLRKSETDLIYEDNEYVDTERLIQVIAALVPQELWHKSEFNKVYTYSQKTRCLKEFQEIWEIAHNSDHKQNEQYKRLYNFYLDIAPQAYELYKKWKSHQIFKGSGLHAIKRGLGGVILEVPDGIVFPILASLSVFAEETSKGWTLTIPEIDAELFHNAKSSYMEVAKSNPNVMGKSKACYSNLAQIASIFARFVKSNRQMPLIEISEVK